MTGRRELSDEEIMQAFEILGLTGSGLREQMSALRRLVEEPEKQTIRTVCASGTATIREEKGEANAELE